MPRLIGMIRVQIPRIIKRNADGSAELVAEIGVEDTGQLWALVVRQTSLSSTDGWGQGVRMFYDRWVRYDAIPFAEDEEPIKRQF